MFRARRNILSSILRNSAAGVLALGLFFVVGCTQSVSATASQTSTGTTTVSITYKVVWDPLGSELANFDATQALVNTSLSNAQITSASGTVTVSVTDLTTDNVVGQQSFGYTIQGNSLYAQNPTAVENWLDQFTGYSDVSVNIAESDLAAQDTASSGTATFSGSSVYEGTTYASASTSWGLGGGTLPCHPCQLGPSKH